MVDVRNWVEDRPVRSNSRIILNPCIAPPRPPRVAEIGRSDECPMRGDLDNALADLEQR